MTVRWSPHWPPRPLAGSSGAITLHASSVNSPVQPARYPPSTCLQHEGSISRSIRQTGSNPAHRHPLRHPLPLAIVGITHRRGRAARRVLPRDQPPLVVVVELCAASVAVVAALCKRGARRAAHHVAAGVVARAVPAAGAGGGMQVGAVAVGVRAPCRSVREAVQRIVAAAGGELRPAGLSARWRWWQLRKERGTAHRTTRPEAPWLIPASGNCG